MRAPRRVPAGAGQGWPVWKTDAGAGEQRARPAAVAMAGRQAGGAEAR